MIVPPTTAPQSPKALAAEDPRIRVLRLSPNGGKPRAMNTMIATARGEWVAVLDADDAYHPQRLARLVAAAEARASRWRRIIFSMSMPASAAPSARVRSRNRPAHHRQAGSRANRQHLRLVRLRRIEAGHPARFPARPRPHLLRAHAPRRGFLLSAEFLCRRRPNLPAQRAACITGPCPSAPYPGNGREPAADHGATIIGRP